MKGERIAYWIVRCTLAGIGGFFILGAVVSHLLLPGLFYDQPEPPSALEFLSNLIMLLGTGVLLALPYRLTLRGWKFWCRLAVSVVAGLNLVHSGLWGIAYSPAPFSLGFACILLGVSMPLCLLWRSRLSRTHSNLSRT